MMVEQLEQYLVMARDVVHWQFPDERELFWRVVADVKRVLVELNWLESVGRLEQWVKFGWTDHEWRLFAELIESIHIGY